jgi:hypothetical protein
VVGREHGRGGLGELARRAVAGAVDEQVDRGLVVAGLGEAALDAGARGRVGEVGDEDLRPGAALPEPPGQRVEAGLVARHEHEVVPPARELLGELGADPRAGAGHERDRPGDRPCHRPRNGPLRQVAPFDDRGPSDGASEPGSSCSRS